jgi:hypothetical protein
VSALHEIDGSTSGGLEDRLRSASGGRSGTMEAYSSSLETSLDIAIKIFFSRNTPDPLSTLSRDGASKLYLL